MLVDPGILVTAVQKGLDMILSPEAKEVQDLCPGPCESMGHGCCNGKVTGCMNWNHKGM